MFTMGIISNILSGSSTQSGSQAVELQAEYGEALNIADSLDVTAEFALDGIDLNGDSIIDDADVQIAKWLSDIQDSLFTGDLAQLLTLTGDELAVFLASHDVNQLLQSYAEGVELLLGGVNGLDMVLISEGGNAQFMGTLMAVQDAASIIGDSLSAIVSGNDSVDTMVQTAIGNITSTEDWQENNDLVVIHALLQEIQQKRQNGESVSQSLESFLELCTQQDGHTLNEAGAVVFGGKAKDDISAQLVEINEAAQNSDLMIGSSAILQQIKSTYGSFDGMLLRINSLIANMYGLFATANSMSAFEKSNDTVAVQKKLDEELSKQMAARMDSSNKQKPAKKQED